MMRTLNNSHSDNSNSNLRPTTFIVVMAVVLVGFLAIPIALMLRRLLKRRQHCISFVLGRATTTATEGDVATQGYQPQADRNSNPPPSAPTEATPQHPHERNNRLAAVVPCCIFQDRHQIEYKLVTSRFSKSGDDVVSDCPICLDSFHNNNNS
jgi:hypothetical protein